jgi:hypothetical protein
MMRAIISFMLVFLTLISRPSVAQIDVTVSFGPPPLPVYVQPPCPDEGYLWTPGYWAYDNYFGYYWVPGTWVQAPERGLLWTPGWWGWHEGAFLFHEGYWAPTVGFYGGINYGFGFFGDGYSGGRWDGEHFDYNRAVSNINVTNIHNTYNTTIVNHVTVNHISYNGGNGGVEARPTRDQEENAQLHHVAPQPAQLRHQQMARANPLLRAEVNHGKPAIAATARPAEFTGSRVVAARAAGGAYQAPEKRLDHASAVPAHQAPSLLRPASPPRESAHGNETSPSHQQAREPTPLQQDRQQERQQQQQRDLVNRQNEQHAQLQAQQQRDHEQAQQKNLNEQRQQEMERVHAQQTAQMEQRHMQQMQQTQNPQHSQSPNRPSAPAHSEGKPPQH